MRPIHAALAQVRYDIQQCHTGDLAAHPRVALILTELTRKRDRLYLALRPGTKPRRKYIQVPRCS